MAGEKDLGEIPIPAQGTREDFIAAIHQGIDDKLKDVPTDVLNSHSEFTVKGKKQGP